MRILLGLFATTVSLFSQQAIAQAPGLPVIDFQRYFPHLVAVSNETRDAVNPEGLQYKFLTVRDENENQIFVALIRKNGSNGVVREFLARGPIDGSEKTLKATVEKFESTTGMKFEFFDLRKVRTFAAYEELVSALGWKIEAISK